MSIYDANFSQVWNSIYPPKLRQPKSLAWGKTILKPLQYLRDLIFEDYISGSTYAPYSSVSAYTANDRVLFTDRGVYENRSGSTGTAPTDVHTWRKVNPNYLGADQRVKYNAQKMVYEAALNNWFMCTGIYISNTPLSPTGLLMGIDGPSSSALSNTTVPFSQSYLINYFTGSSTSCYTIYVPNIVFTGLSSTFSGRTSIIRSFANKLNIAGMQYSVSGY